MAFLNRGSRPDLNFSDIQTGDGNNGKSPHRGLIRFRIYSYIPLDNSYAITQLIIALIIFIIGIIAFFTTYKTTIIDPIADIKSSFINTHLIALAILLGLTIAVNFLSKSADSLIFRIKFIFVFSMIFMLAFLGYRLNLDNQYTEEKFGQFYNEQVTEDSSDGKKMVDINILSVDLKTEKEYYVDECIESYNVFKVRTYAILGVHLLLNILLIYQMSKISKMQKQRENVNKDDLILFDEEKNLRI